MRCVSQSAEKQQDIEIQIRDGIARIYLRTDHQEVPDTGEQEGTHWECEEAFMECPDDEAPEEEDDPDDAYLEAAPAEDVPTLEDYLSTLHCGRCGRNCYLSNPRCRTGRGKAETATAEYYAEYGDESEL